MPATLSIGAGQFGCTASQNNDGSGCRSGDTTARLQARVNRFRFEGEDSEDTLVHAIERLATHEAFEGLDAHGPGSYAGGSQDWLRAMPTR
jgi:hypothetical protein